MGITGNIRKLGGSKSGGVENAGKGGKGFQGRTCNETGHTMAGGRRNQQTVARIPREEESPKRMKERANGATSAP